jgi:RHS repeat-associated protein
VKADTAQGHVEYVLDGKYVLREAGARQRRYHFGEGEALAVTGVGGTGAQDRWLHTDALGSVVTEVDATAAAVTARQYDAWGNYRHGTAPGVSETRLGYTGHQYDVETGLTYARARYYDSKLGVFLSRDSFEGVLTEAPSLHRYTYAGNSPLKYVDPSGRCFYQSCAEMLFGDEDAPEGPQPDAPVQVVAPKGKPGSMTLSEQAETAKVTTAMKSREDRRQVMDNASLSDALMYDYGELLGGNSMARAYTGEDETGRKLSRLERAENAFDATSKVVDAALIVEGGAGVLLERKAAQQGLKQAAKRAETTALEAPELAGAMMCPCFEAGTVVHTAEGQRAIEDVRVGDLVLSRDDKTGAFDYRPVVQLFVTPEKEVFELRLADETGTETILSVTPGHPFWVKDIGWVGAASLASGIEVANSSGGWLRVTGATWHQRKATVFNFEVEGFHTYFVGEAAAWVHNACSPECKRVGLAIRREGVVVKSIPVNTAPPAPIQWSMTRVERAAQLNELGARAAGVSAGWTKGVSAITVTEDAATGLRVVTFKAPANTRVSAEMEGAIQRALGENEIWGGSNRVVHSEMQGQAAVKGPAAQGSSIRACEKCQEQSRPNVTLDNPKK